MANHNFKVPLQAKLSARVVAGKPNRQPPIHLVVPGQVGNGKLGLSNQLPPRSTYNSGDLND